ncbi:MAG: PEP-CTERM sorting domain-containing protein [Verrucomicrobiota bacterium]|nr:PEP-CTERM sorting domain-containing protein [Verrucomicrobiota bacterium]MDQ6938881.1 PEP-CTERM sorting domain-containing protein [Verrucomicrobiota bacterium]
MKTFTDRLNLGVFFLTTLLLTLPLQGATVPYQDSFDSYPNGATPSGFTNNASGLNTMSSWSVAQQSNGGVYFNNLYTNQGNTTTGISITNLSGMDFTFSTTFTLGGFFTTSGFYNCSVGIFGFASSPSSTVSGYSVSYETFTANYPYAQPGDLSLGGVETHLPGSGSNLPLSTSVTYTMTLSGVYTTNGLLLTASLSDGTNTISQSGLDSTPATGTYFGYYSGASASVQRGISTSIAFDNFSVNVPEPKTISSLLIAGLGLLATKLRRSRPRAD